MNIPSKNNNQSSVSVKASLNKQSIQIFNRDKVYDHVSTNSNDVGIPRKEKDVDISKHVNVNIPQNINVNIPSKNNNLSSVPVKVSLNKQSIQMFNRDKVNDHCQQLIIMST